MSGELEALAVRVAAIPGDCGYWDDEWSCREGGYLWDADGDGYDESDVTHACPRCNTREYLENAVEHASGWSSYQWIYTSGAERMRYSIEKARAANPEIAEAALADIGPITCLDWRDPDCPNPNDTVTVIENASAPRAHSQESTTHAS